jgi:2-hydroxychromene-2-carboxylate isomerase
MGGVADLTFYFDPVCPFAWMTSRWVRQVQRLRDYTVEWKPISLRLLNAHVDYDAQFPEGYEVGHTAGLRLLRVAARVREEHGADAVGDYYAAVGAAIFDVDPAEGGLEDQGRRGTAAFVEPALAAAGLPTALSAALDDESWDAGIQASTDEALGLTGRDVGTPIIHVEPPEGVAFFGPVISRQPTDDEAVQLWDHVVGLARFPGFAELKRSLRELPQLRGLGVAPDEVGTSEDWHGGSRRQHH